MNRKGFIFDLDGVIVDTARYHYLAWRKLANGLGIDFSEEQNEQLKGVSRVRSLQKILKWGDIEISEEKFIDLMATKNRDYLEYIKGMNETEILPDVNRIIDFLKEHEQFVSLGSASKNARMILKQVKLFDIFDAIVDGNDVTKAKPDPEVFLIAAKQINVLPQNCVVFEDSIAGIKAANSVNMVSIGIGNKETLKEADYVFNDFTEMSFDFISKLIQRNQLTH